MSVHLAARPVARTSRIILEHQAFRACLLAMSYPGQSFALPCAESLASAHHNGQLSQAESAAALLFGAIWESDASVCSVGAVPFLPASVRQVDPSQADVLIVRGACSHGAIRAARRGTEEAPEGGASVLFVLPDSPARTAVRLSGPGIRGSLETELPLLRVELLDRNVACADWPLGVDAIVVDGSAQVLALPRTTRVEVLD